MAKKLLTTRGLDSLKPADKRYDVMDSDTRGLGVRVGTTGKRTFIMFTRFPGSSAPIRAQLGEYPAMSLDAARDKARDWRNEIRKGNDPRDSEKAALVEQARKRENTFRAVAEDYITWLPKRPGGNRHAEQDAREIRRELMDGERNPWLDKPIADVTDTMVAKLIREIAERPLRRIKRDENGKPIKASEKPIDRRNYMDVFEWVWEDVPGRTATGAAFNTLGHVKGLFRWATSAARRDDYGLTINVLAALTPSECELHTKKDTERDRVLSDVEISAYWKAANATPYPLGPFFKMLLLTGQRKSEVSAAEWSEFDFDKRIWTVPAERFKSGQDHIVPISDQLFALLDALPRGEAGDFVFSTTNGKKPINGFSRAKGALDAAMSNHLKKPLAGFVLHDVRRTMRTKLSGIRQIRTEVAELVIGHSKKGLVRVYDQHKYEDELIEALQLWADKLDTIITPQPPKHADNVVSLRA